MNETKRDWDAVLSTLYHQEFNNAKHPLVRDCSITALRAVADYAAAEEVKRLAASGENQVSDWELARAFTVDIINISEQDIESSKFAEKSSLVQKLRTRELGPIAARIEIAEASVAELEALLTHETERRLMAEKWLGFYANPHSYDCPPCSTSAIKDDGGKIARAHFDEYGEGK